MSNKFIVILKDGEFRTKNIRQPPAPRRNLAAWLSRCASVAIEWRAKRYIFRFGGQWHILNVNHPEPIRSFPVREAAEMYLLHVGERDA